MICHLLQSTKWSMIYDSVWHIHNPTPKMSLNMFMIVWPPVRKSSHKMRWNSNKKKHTEFTDASSLVGHSLSIPGKSSNLMAMPSPLHSKIQQIKIKCSSNCWTNIIERGNRFINNIHTQLLISKFRFAKLINLFARQLYLVNWAFCLTHLIILIILNFVSW